MSSHYFATCAFGWATADTRDEAITKLVNRFRTDCKRVAANCIKEGQPGMYFWTCKVHAPSDANYAINFYQPQGVETSEHKEHAITKVLKNSVTWTDGYPETKTA